MAPAKKKTEKMSLGTFLQDENYGSWADEMEDMPLPSTESRSGYGGERRAFSSTTGTGNGYNDRRDGYPPREQLPLPTEPPYTAHLGNMSFDTTEAEVSDFFKDCQVTKVRIVEDKMDRKPKGFGYVEFASLDGLKKALSYAGSSLAGRTIRVSVADPPKERQDGRDFSDWSRKGPLPDLPGQQRRVSDRPSFPSRSLDNTSDAGSDRGSRRQFDQGDGKVRDFSNWERKGPLSPAIAAAPPSLSEGGRQRSKDGPAFRKSSPAWGEGTGRSQDGARPSRREYQEKPPVERPPMASELDNQWRSKMRPDAPAKSPTPSRDPSNPPSPAPATRPKLNLQKRTVSEAEPGSSPATTTPALESKASPFGAARPVDTSAKEKEIEEKREMAIRQRKEAEEKARAEKAEEKRLAKEAKDKALAEKGPKEAGPTADEDNGTEKNPAGKHFEILRRGSENENGMEADEEEAEGDAPVAPTDDKAVKPKEIVRDAPPAKGAGGAWRGQHAQGSGAPAEDTAKSMDEDGWSTVSNTKPRNSRRTNQAARAIAS